MKYVSWEIGRGVANHVEWISWNLYKDVVTNYYTSKKEVYIPFAEDIFAAIQDGARTWADYRKNKKQMNEMD